MIFVAQPAVVNTQIVAHPANHEYDDFDFSLDDCNSTDFDLEIPLLNYTVCDSDTNTNTDTTDNIYTTGTTETVDISRGSMRARVDIEPELGAPDNDICQLYTDIRDRV